MECVAEECGVKVHHLSASDIYGAYTGEEDSSALARLQPTCMLRPHSCPGESERQLREAFERARTDAAAGTPSLVFIDELDTLAPKRDGSRPHEARVVAQLLTLLDGAAANAGECPSWHRMLSSALHAGIALYTDTLCALAAADSGHLTFIGATNKPNAIDPALRRLGRLEREVAVNLPDTGVRKILCSAPAHQVMQKASKQAWQ